MLFNMSTIDYTKIKAVLFDLDGVLVNMPDGHYEAVNKAIELFGARIDRDEHESTFNGLPTKRKIEMLVEQKRLPDGLRNLINGIKQKYTKESIPRHCVPDYSKIIMLNELKKKGYKLACVSNSINETQTLMLRSAQIIDYFDEIIGNDQVTKNKPDPEAYLVTFERLGLQPEECLIVEDSPHGIAAAKASGGHVIEVRGVEDVYITLFNDLLNSK